MDEQPESSTDDERSRVDKILQLPGLANSMVAAAAILVAGVLWLGLDVTPAWPGWLAAAAGLALTLRPR
jgi:hypothetical protein